MLQVYDDLDETWMFGKWNMTLKTQGSTFSKKSTFS